MKDEEYLFRQDGREKANIARSARNRRTHTGKSGRVKFPSDYKTKKELNAMNGEVKSYRLNEPMKWEEFKSMPDDLKAAYVNAIREKFHVPDNEIAIMFGVDRITVGKWFRCLGLGLGKSAGGRKKWDKEGWLAWCNGAPAPVPAEEVEEEPEEIVEDIVEDIVPYEPAPEVEQLPVCEEQKNEGHTEVRYAIPSNGNMVFEGKVDDVLNTLRVLLGGAYVHLGITWDVLPEPIRGRSDG